jgi:hypothetical protein
MLRLVKRTNCLSTVFLCISTTSTNVPELGGGSGIFRGKRILVGSARCVTFEDRRCFDLWSRRLIVTRKSPASIFDCAAVQFVGEALCVTANSIKAARVNFVCFPFAAVHLMSVKCQQATFGMKEAASFNSK